MKQVIMYEANNGQVFKTEKEAKLTDIRLNIISQMKQTELFRSNNEISDLTLYQLQELQRIGRMAEAFLMEADN